MRSKKETTSSRRLPNREGARTKSCTTISMRRVAETIQKKAHLERRKKLAENGLRATKEATSSAAILERMKHVFELPTTTGVLPEVQPKPKPTQIFLHSVSMHDVMVSKSISRALEPHLPNRPRTRRIPASQPRRVPEFGSLIAEDRGRGGVSRDRPQFLRSSQGHTATAARRRGLFGPTPETRRGNQQPSICAHILYEQLAYCAGSSPSSRRMLAAQHRSTALCPPTLPSLSGIQRPAGPGHDQASGRPRPRGPFLERLRLGYHLVAKAANEKKAREQRRDNAVANPTYGTHDRKHDYGHRPC
jgi:hypothetical protein